MKKNIISLLLLINYQALAFEPKDYWAQLKKANQPHLKEKKSLKDDVSLKKAAPIKPEENPAKTKPLRKRLR